ncbi:MAG: hypothetical protein U1E10_15345 [Bdellovibrionales bacterium]|nr:hypothetical protein [Bdellovibrionales bacterium]
MVRTLARVGKYVLLLAGLAACSPAAEVPNSKANASTSGTGTNGSNVAPIVGSSPAPSTTNSLYTAGQVYGSCMHSLNSSFAITNVDANPTYPITSCTTAGDPVCASGFQLVYDTPVQMNCSSTPSGSSVLPCYYKMHRCMKIQDSQANTNYVAGTAYGICIRKMNSAFQTDLVYLTAGIITNCSTTAVDPACPAGFRVVSDAPTQMNCSSNPSATVEPCYFKTQRCVKI